MSGKLENRVAVITGGSTGIGFATAKRFVAEGAFVFITGRRAPELNRAAETLGPRAVTVLADSSNLGDLDRLYELINREAGRIDILFANAGGGSNLPLGSITEQQYDDTFGRNVKGVLFTVQKALPLLVDGASVILTGSTASIVAMPAFSVYGASKAALRSFARHWTLDLKARRIALAEDPVKVANHQSLDAVQHVLFSLVCAFVCAQTCAWPPSTKSSTPVTKLESSDARNSAALAISSGSATRPSGSSEAI